MLLINPRCSLLWNLQATLKYCEWWEWGCHLPALALLLASSL